MGVVPEYTIQAKTDTSSGELAWVRAANNGKRSMNVGALARMSPDLKGARVLQPRMADTNEQLQELKPLGDSDDATRRPLGSRLPPRDLAARPFAQTGSFDRVTSARGHDGNSRSKLGEFAPSAVRGSR